MSKRTIEETTATEFSIDDSNEQLRKKIKLLNDNIIERVKEIDEEIDISEHEVDKFLLIFQSLFKIMTSEETSEETDGILNDTILAVCNIIVNLLRNNIDSLKLQAILKTALKKLRSLFVGVKEKKSEVKTGESESETEIKEIVKLQVQAKETDGLQRRGERKTMTGLE